MFLSTSPIVLVPDWTIVVQLGVFLLALWTLSNCIVRPLLRVRDQRRMATVDTVTKTKSLDDHAEEQLAEYRRRIEEARQEGLATKEKLRQDGYAAASEVMATARKAAFARLDVAKTQMVAEAMVARKLLEANAGEFARAISERILERSLVDSPRQRVSHGDLVGKRQSS